EYGRTQAAMQRHEFGFAVGRQCIEVDAGRELDACATYTGREFEDTRQWRRPGVRAELAPSRIAAGGVGPERTGLGRGRPLARLPLNGLDARVEAAGARVRG